MRLRVGTRASTLALAQTREVVDGLADMDIAADTVTITTAGDASRSVPLHLAGVAGAFTSRLEHALIGHEVDLAVHSLKDLPLKPAGGTRVAAVLPRGPPGDTVLIRPGAHAPEATGLPLTAHARVATSAPRRKSQLLDVRQDLTIVDVRGNVDTRLAKLRAGWFDALVMATAALQRAALTTDEVAVHRLDPTGFPCAPGQGAIAVQARTDDDAAAAAARLDHSPTRHAVEAERRVLAALGGGCGLPLGVYARIGTTGARLDATLGRPNPAPAAHAPRLRRVALAGTELARLADQASVHLRKPDERAARPLSITDDRPLVLVLASPPTIARYAPLLAERGFDARGVPTLQIEPGEPIAPALDGNLGKFDWIVVTSGRAVDPLADHLNGRLPDVNVAAVGPATCRALHEATLPCHLVAPEGTAASLAEELVRLSADKPGKVLVVRGDRARDDVPRILSSAGIRIDSWTAYRTRRLSVDLTALGAKLPAAAAIITSPSGVDAIPRGQLTGLAGRLVAMGPTTAAALRRRGVEPVTLRAPTAEALLEVLS